MEDFAVNLGATVSLLEALRARRVPLVFASTNKVYGDLADVALARSGEAWLPTDADIRRHGIGEDRPISLHTPYGCSKGAADQYVLDYARSFDVPTAVLRMSCIYGPRQFGTEDQGWVAHFLIRALEGRPIAIFGDGRQVRDVLYVDDAVPVPVIGKLEKEPGIKKMFNQFYSDGINAVNIAKAIAAFERRLITVSSPFDRYLYGKADAISEKAKSGYQLFKNMGCVSCHQGQNLGGNLFQYFGVMDNYFQDRGNIKKADYGRYNVTGKEEDRFKFKVPSLRNIALTAPYFHDASAETLGDAIRVMARYQLGRPITESQVDQIEAFLLTLTGEVEEELK